LSKAAESEGLVFSWLRYGGNRSPEPFDAVHGPEPFDRLRPRGPSRGKIEGLVEGNAEGASLPAIASRSGEAGGNPLQISR